MCFFDFAMLNVLMLFFYRELSLNRDIQLIHNKLFVR